jgi:hypothetical protein
MGDEEVVHHRHHQIIDAEVLQKRVGLGHGGDVVVGDAVPHHWVGDVGEVAHYLHLTPVKRWLSLASMLASSRWSVALMSPSLDALVAWRASRRSAKDSSACSEVSLLGMVTKEEEIGGKVSWLEENTLETRPVNQLN